MMELIPTDQMNDKFHEYFHNSNIFKLPDKKKTVIEERSYNIYYLKDSSLYETEKLDIDSYRKEEAEFIRTDNNSKENDYVSSITTKTIEENSALKVILISAPAGMGKTTELIKFSHFFNERPTDYWIWNVDMTEHLELLHKLHQKKEENKEITKEDSVRFLSQSVTPKRDCQEKIESKITKTGGIILLLDGIDEILPEYIDITVEIINHLKDTQINKIILAACENVAKKIDDSVPKAFTYILQGLNPEQQENLLTDLFNQKIAGGNSDKQQRKIREYSRSVLKLYKSKDRKFTSYPLHIELLAEVFFESSQTLQQGCLEYEETEIKLPEAPFDLLSIYKKIIERKFRNRCRVLSPNIDSISSYFQKYPKFLHNYSNFSLLSVSDENMLSEFYSKNQLQAIKEEYNQFSKNVEDIGIIEKFVGYRPKFIHRSFADYFLANNCVLLLNEETESKCIIKDLLAKLLFLPVFSGVRKFLNQLLDNYNEYVSANNAKHFSKLWRDGKMKTNSPILCIAAAEGNYNIVSLILENLKNYEMELREEIISQKIVSSSNLSLTAIHLAAENGYLNIIQILEEHGAVLDEPSDGWTPLLLAAKSGHIDIFKYLEGKVSKTTKNLSKSTALHWAAENGHLDVVHFFSHTNKLFDESDDENWTPLHLAVLFNHQLVIQFLTNLMDITVRLEKEEEGTKTAVKKTKLKNTKKIKWSKRTLLKNFFDLIKPGTKDIEKSLYIAIMTRQYEQIESMLRKITDIDNLKDQFNASPLHWASFTNVDIVKLLIKKSKKKIDQMQDYWGMTPLHYAARDLHKSEIIMEELVKHANNVDCMDEKGWTPLMFAAKNGLVSVVDFLLSKGAKVNVQDKYDSTTPLHWAARFGHINTVKLLIDNGADTSLRTGDHKTALNLAEQYNYSEVAALLKKQGD